MSADIRVLEPSPPVNESAVELAQTLLDGAKSGHIKCIAAGWITRDGRVQTKASATENAPELLGAISFLQFDTVRKWGEDE